MDFEDTNIINLNLIGKTSNEVIFEISPDQKFLNKENHFDKGYLFSLVDTVSSKSAFFFDNDLLLHVSIKINVIYFKELHFSEKSIIIKTKVKSSNKLVYLECCIYDKKENLILSAIHLKRKIKYKF